MKLIEEKLLTDVASSLQQGVGSSAAGRNLPTPHNVHDGSDNWTRSDGPLMTTNTANKFVDFVQNLDIDSELAETWMSHHNTPGSQMGGRDPYNQSPRMTSPGDLLQPERISNGFVFTIVKKKDLAMSTSSHDMKKSSAQSRSVLQTKLLAEVPDTSSSRLDRRKVAVLRMSTMNKIGWTASKFCSCF